MEISKGARFGRWVVVDLVGGRSCYCRCDCGEEKQVDISSLRSETSRSCGCYRSERSSTVHKNSVRARGSKNVNWTGSADIPGRYWSNLKSGAKRRGILFEITIAEAQDLFVDQGRCCALTGRLLRFGSRDLGIDTTASLDRIDSKGAYVSGNCQWLHKELQIMKNRFGQMAFIQACREVTQCASE